MQARSDKRHADRALGDGQAAGGERQALRADARRIDEEQVAPRDVGADGDDAYRQHRGVGEPVDQRVTGRQCPG